MNRGVLAIVGIAMLAGGIASLHQGYAPEGSGYVAIAGMGIVAWILGHALGQGPARRRALPLAPIDQERILAALENAQGDGEEIELDEESDPDPEDASHTCNDHGCPDGGMQEPPELTDAGEAAAVERDSDLDGSGTMPIPGETTDGELIVPPIAESEAGVTSQEDVMLNSDNSEKAPENLPVEAPVPEPDCNGFCVGGSVSVACPPHGLKPTVPA